MANIIIKDYWRAIIKLMPTDIKAELYDAICAYQAGEDVKLSDDAAAVFEAFRRDMDLSRARSAAGRSGGLAKWLPMAKQMAKPAFANGKGSGKTMICQWQKEGEDTIPTDTTAIQATVDSNNISICEYPTSMRIEEGKKECRERTEENQAGIAVIPEASSGVVISEDFAKFQSWIRDNAPRVARMKRPFRESEFRTLQSKYGAAEVAKVLKDMDNYRPLIEKNMSAYLTAIKWIEKERDRRPQDQSNFVKVAKVVASVNQKQDERAAAGIKRFTMYGND